MTLPATVTRHLDDLEGRHPALAPIRDQVCDAFEMLRECVAVGGTIYLCGNGGSAADAEHWAGELVKGFESKRPLTSDERNGLGPDLADRLQRGIRAVPLTGFVSLRTAVANDVAGEMEFAQLAWTFCGPGDVLVGISTSGNSRNVVLAMQAAAARGARTLALVGAGGGTMGELADHSVRVPATRTLHVQEQHLPVYHCLCLMLEDQFYG
ncbi:MAG: SIS domain-containing protein [Phycisphaerales bacterium JB050]